MLIRCGTAAVLSGALLLTGCGGSDEPGTVTLGSSSSATPTSEPAPTTAPPSDDGPIPKEPVEGTLTRGLSAAAGDEQVAIGEVWFGYWSELLRMFRTGESDQDALYALADDSAAGNALDYADGLQDKDFHQTGGVVAAITKVKVDGDTATVIGCFRNSTVDVNAAGEPVELPHAFFTTRDTLRREGPDWRVTEQVTDTQDTPCAYR